MKHEGATHTPWDVCAYTVEYFNQRLKANRKLTMNRRLVFWIF